MLLVALRINQCECGSDLARDHAVSLIGLSINPWQVLVVIAYFGLTFIGLLTLIQTLFQNILYTNS